MRTEKQMSDVCILLYEDQPQHRDSLLEAIESCRDADERLQLVVIEAEASIDRSFPRREALDGECVTLI